MRASGAKFLRSFQCAFQGITWALRSQRNLRIHLGATLAVILWGLYENLPGWKWCCLFLCIALVWLAELFNTALEVLCDRITQQPDESIRLAKDVSAAAVLVTAFFTVIVGAVVFLTP